MTTTDKKGLNGSVDLLASAMRQVFTEAVQGAVGTVETEVKALRTEVRDMRGDIDSMRENMATKADLDTTNKNVHAQLAQHREDVRADIQQALKGE